MTVRVAVATARYGDPWDELSVLAGRLAAALACTADVDVLIPAAGAEAEWDGACRLLRFPASAVDRRILSAWRKLALGVDGNDGPADCTCTAGETTQTRLPALVEEQLVLAEGGDAPALYEHLRATPYDAVVFVGLHTPLAYFGVRAVPESRRAFIVPGPDKASFGLAIHEESLARAERILVCTETERRWIVERVGACVDRVENLGFLLGVNTVVRPESSGGLESRSVVVAGDWRSPNLVGRSCLWSEKLAHRLPDGVTLRLVGPGATHIPQGVPHTDARIDAWWWMSRAVTVVDFVPDRVIGQEVLEAMLLGVPVVVPANGGATREHAELGNAGLWYRAEDELLASIRRLLDGDIAESLGEQGRSYAAANFSDTDTYVKRVADLVLG